jgi:hypothetical protein
MSKGKHMCSKEGIKYFKQAETEWKGVYMDEKLMKISLHSVGRLVGEERNRDDGRRGFRENFAFSYGNVDR